MKYYVMADIHGFYTPMIKALEDAGYFDEKCPHKLIICGDLFDRGKEALKVQEFVMQGLAKDEIILIRGNHEDLAISMLNNWHRNSFLEVGHILNGTVDTALQLTGVKNKAGLLSSPFETYRNFADSPYISQIIPQMLDYYETENYLFVHGWIPSVDWRNATSKDWADARWLNGMEQAHNGVVDKNKTIVCGHWHTSFGHYHYEGKGSEFGSNADYSIYSADGIIALDACTVETGRINCLVIKDQNCN